MARRPISLSLRFSVYARDKHTCQYCGGKPPDVVLQLDHVYPVALGGTNGIDNLLTACRDCNLGKGARDPGLAMASRPATQLERRAIAREQARWWAHYMQTAAPIKALLWEMAAKAEEDGAEFRIETEARRTILGGLVAVGFVRVLAHGHSEAWVQIEHGRGRDDILDSAPWGVGSFSGPAHLPSVAEVH